MISDIEILRFEITYFSNLAHDWYVVVIIKLALKGLLRPALLYWQILKIQLTVALLALAP